MKPKNDYPFCDICGKIKDECACLEKLIRISGFFTRFHNIKTKEAREKYELLQN